MTARERRRVVGKVQAAVGISERRATRFTGFPRSTIRYRSRREPQEKLRGRIRALAAERPRWGYRRIHTLLRREGWAVNRKRVQRLYRQEGLAVVQNCFVESFIGSFRDECLNLHWFISIHDARRTIERWRKDYNRVRPHSSLGDLTPEEFVKNQSLGEQSLALNISSTVPE